VAMEDSRNPPQRKLWSNESVTAVEKRLEVRGQQNTRL
jgi:hypothetical protein